MLYDFMSQKLAKLNIILEIETENITTILQNLILSLG